MKDRTKKFSYAASSGSKRLGEFLKKVKKDKKGEEKESPVKKIGQLSLDSFKKLKNKIKD